MKTYFARNDNLPEAVSQLSRSCPIVFVERELYHPKDKPAYASNILRKAVLPFTLFALALSSLSCASNSLEKKVDPVAPTEKRLIIDRDDFGLIQGTRYETVPKTDPKK
jgi:hypothetical protein